MPTALEAGVSILDYWNLDIEEIAQVSNAYVDRYKREQTAKRVNDYNLASMIASFVGLSLNGKPIPDFNKLYPNDNEARNEMESAHITMMKESLLAFADRRNKTYKTEV